MGDQSLASLSVAQSLIDEANHLEMRDLAAKRDVEKTKMSEEASPCLRSCAHLSLHSIPMFLSLLS